MRRFRLLCALAASFVSGCSHDPAARATTPTGPCHDSENLVNGRCVTRIPGDGQPASPPGWTRP